MPVYRGPDGKIIEENTRSISSSQKPSGADDNIDGKTRRLSSRPIVPPSSNEVEAQDKISGQTKIFKASSNKKTSSSKKTSEAGAKEDPVVGWLVVVDGLGRGADFSLGYGVNAIGRGENERVTLDFGDTQISRESHAILTYDPKGKQFFIQGGGGRNLTYLNDEVVLTPTLLSDKSIIQIGETSLKFVSFCDDNFNWED